jgi:hypothetical protein
MEPCSAPSPPSRQKNEQNKMDIEMRHASAMLSRLRGKPKEWQMSGAFGDLPIIFAPTAKNS